MAGIVAVGTIVFVAAFVVLQGRNDSSTDPVGSETEPACAVGPYGLAAGESKPIRLKARRGDRISGTLNSEYSEDDFDFGIYDSEGTAQFERREKATAERRGRGKNAYRISWTVPYEGPWYLILSTRGRKTRRKIEVDLERES